MSTTSLTRARTWGVLVLLAACAPVPAPSASAPVAASHPQRGSGAMRPPRATTMQARLAAAGLDAKNLPPIETLDPKQKLKVMRTFTASLGVACVDCHAGVDFAADTRRKRVAKRMWNELTRVVALESGEPVYCDSCHQGDLYVLDRNDKPKLAGFMLDAYDQALVRSDGRPHDCATCHGDPMDRHFLEKWRESPAPDLAR